MKHKKLTVFILLTALLLNRPAVARADDLALFRWRTADAQTQSFVLALARRAFNTYITHRNVIDPPAVMPSLLKERVGIFVSTMRNGAPRCCMGTLYPAEPNAAQEIITNAVTAAGRDARFPPIKPGEMNDLILIVSIVGQPRTLIPGEPAMFDPARDGLVVKNGDRCGVVLSGETDQVARMVQWGRIRAGAGKNTPVQMFHIDVVRFVEKPAGTGTRN